MFTIIFHLFAYPREKLNTQKLTHTFTTSITLNELISFLTKEYPGIPFERYRYAISQTYVKDWNSIYNKDTEIYVIPPISGG